MKRYYPVFNGIITVPSEMKDRVNFYAERINNTTDAYEKARAIDIYNLFLKNMLRQLPKDIDDFSVTPDNYDGKEHIHFNLPIVMPDSSYSVNFMLFNTKQVSYRHYIPQYDMDTNTMYLIKRKEELYDIRMHKECLGVRGIKSIECKFCGKKETNYSNGVEICKECTNKLNLCLICGKEL